MEASSPPLDLEKCLSICLSHGAPLREASSFLLERMGRVSQALDLYLEDLHVRICDMDAAIARKFLGQCGNSKAQLEESELWALEEVIFCTTLTS